MVGIGFPVPSKRERRRKEEKEGKSHVLAVAGHLTGRQIYYDGSLERKGQAARDQWQNRW